MDDILKNRIDLLHGRCKVSLDAIRQLNYPLFSPKFTAWCCVRCRKGPVYKFRAAKAQKQWQVLSFTAGTGSEQLLCPSRGMEWDPSSSPCCSALPARLELGEQCPGKGKEPGLKGARLCEGKKGRILSSNKSRYKFKLWAP